MVTFGKSLLILTVSLPLACQGQMSDGAGAAGSTTTAGAGAEEAGAAGSRTGDASLIVPEALDVIPLAGLTSVFTVTALTLLQGQSSAELYAAVRHDGTVPVCNPSFSVVLNDENGDSIAAGISGLMVKRYYRISDGEGAGSIAGCVAPGDVTMVAINDSSLSVEIGDVAQVVYRSSYWTLDIEPVTGLSLSNVRMVSRATGIAYTGTLDNGLDAALGSPGVEVFPLNRAGRPLGVASATGTTEVAPSSSWDFETNTVSDPGVDYAAFPAGGS